MLIGYSQPQPSAITLSGGAGFAWLTADEGAACCDGKPARRARFRWRSDAVPDTSHFVAVVLDVPSTPVRVLALLGLAGVPAGTRIVALGKRAADGAATWNFGGSNEATVRRGADGSLGAWLVLPAGAEPVERVALRIYNDNGGVTWADANTAVDVGEAVAMPAVEVDAEQDWSIEVIDPTVSTRSVGAQPSSVRRRAYRQVTANLVAESVSVVRGGGLAGNMDWDALRMAMSGDRRAVVIARWRAPDGTADADEINRTAIYGVGRIAATEHVVGPWYRSGVVMQEVPD